MSDFLFSSLFFLRENMLLFLDIAVLNLSEPDLTKWWKVNGIWFGILIILHDGSYSRNM